MPLSYAQLQLKKHHNLCFLTTLMAPKEHRQGLATLLLFNHELARIQYSISEPTSGLIRLQWWRDTLDKLYSNSPSDHPLTEDLKATIDCYDIEKNSLIDLIDARDPEIDFSPLANDTALESYCTGTTTNSLILLLRVLGEDKSLHHTTIHHLGQAVGVTRIIRNTTAHLKKNKLFFTSNLAQTYNTSIEALITNPDRQVLTQMTNELLPKIKYNLEQIRHVKVLKPLLAHAYITSAYITQLERHNGDFTHPRVEAFTHLMPLKLWTYSLLK